MKALKKTITMTLIAFVAVIATASVRSYEARMLIVEQAMQDPGLKNYAEAYQAGSYQ